MEPFVWEHPSADRWQLPQRGSFAAAVTAAKNGWWHVTVWCGLTVSGTYCKTREVACEWAETAIQNWRENYHPPLPDLVPHGERLTMWGHLMSDPV